MGTRGLTCVMKDGEYKVAQYGQWDHYPEGQGKTILNFLRTRNLDTFSKKLSSVRFLDEKNKDKDMLDSYIKNSPEWSSDPDNRTQDQKRWFEEFLTRDIGGKILENIFTSNEIFIILRDEIDFTKDSLMCEFVYVIDLDKGTFEIYQGFNQCPLKSDERFYSRNPNEGGYYPVCLLKEYKITDLPTEEEFLKEMNKLLEDEDDE